MGPLSSITSPALCRIGLPPSPARVLWLSVGQCSTAWMVAPGARSIGSDLRDAVPVLTALPVSWVAHA
jgi:hypothetical protein